MPLMIATLRTLTSSLSSSKVIKSHYEGTKMTRRVDYVAGIKGNRLLSRRIESRVESLSSFHGFDGFFQIRKSFDLELLWLEVFRNDQYFD